MADGILTRESPYAFRAIVERVERAIAEDGLIVFAHINDQAAARRNGLEMQAATLLVFGNPRIGTPAMVREPLVALDLPLRVLVWEQEGRVRVSCQEPGFVARRFGIGEEIPAHAEALLDSPSVCRAVRPRRRGARTQRATPALQSTSIRATP